MNGLCFDEARRSVEIAAESLGDARASQTIARITQWADSRETVSIDLSLISYLDWVAFDFLLEIVRGTRAKVRFSGASPNIRSLFVLNRMEMLLDEQTQAPSRTTP